MEAYVWALDEKRQVLVTDDPGPPLGGRFIGRYALPEGGGWGEAQKVADEVAKHDPKQPYEIVYEAPLTGPAEDNDRVCQGCDEVIEDCTCEHEEEPEPLLFSCSTEDCIFQGPHYASECVTAEQMEEHYEENEKESRVAEQNRSET